MNVATLVDRAPGALLEMPRHEVCRNARPSLEQTLSRGARPWNAVTAERPAIDALAAGGGWLTWTARPGVVRTSLGQVARSSYIDVPTEPKPNKGV